jgi:hypothetical protein
VKKFKDYPIQVVRLRDVLDGNDVSTIQFLKIDVEGYEYEVIISNDWEKYRPEVVCVEANHIDKDWRSFLISKNYSLVFFDGLNEYYTDNNTKRSEKFDYVNSVIYKEPILYFSVLEDFTRLNKKVNELSLLNDSLNLRINLLDQEVQSITIQARSLMEQLDEVIPLKRHIKRSIRFRLKRIDNKIITVLTRSNIRKIPPIKINNTANFKDLIEKISKYDRNIFANYNHSSRRSLSLKIYTKLKAITFKLLYYLRSLRVKN